MAEIPGFPWVRTQIHPDAKRAAWRVHNQIGWTLPGIYTFCIHYLLMTHTSDEVTAMMVKELALEEPTLEGEE